jgi:chromosome segregation ATPase
MMNPEEFNSQCNDLAANLFSIINDHITIIGKKDTEISELKKQAEKTAIDSKKTYDSLMELKDSIYEKLRYEQEKRKELQNTLKNEKMHLELHLKEIFSLKKEKEEIRNQLVVREGEVQELKNKIEIVIKEKEEYAGQMNLLQSENERNSSLLKRENERNLNFLKGENEMLKREIESLNSANSTKQKEINDLNARCRELELEAYLLDEAIEEAEENINSVILEAQNQYLNIR